jgi:hypothetical protein
MLDVPIRGVISDGQRSIRKAVQAALPDVPHQLCHFHAPPAKRPNRSMKQIGMRNLELKKWIRGVRPIERAVEKRNDAEAEAICGYCLAVRSALTDDGRAPLEAPGLTLHERLSAIAASLTRVSEKRACRVS